MFLEKELTNMMNLFIELALMKGKSEVARHNGDMLQHSKSLVISALFLTVKKK